MVDSCTTVQLSAIFRAHHADPVEDEAGLEAALAARVGAGRAAWPAMKLEDEVFVQHLALHAEAGRLPPLEHSADLWLACACGAGVHAAANELGRVYRGVIERAVAKVSHGVTDDVTQAVLTSLLVRDGETEPRILKYRGQVPLRAWLSTVASRAAIDKGRRRSAQPHESASGLADVAMRIEPELAMAKAKYAPQLEEALRDALTVLDARQRLLLRLHHAEGWSVDRLGALYHVGRSTSARWLVAARQLLLDATKAKLRERLRISPAELESLVGVLQSNIEVSLIRLLEHEEPPAEK